MSKRNRQATKKAAEGASGSGRQQPDSKSLPNGIGKAKQSAEWVAEIPVDAQSGEEVDACGDYMSHVFRLAEVIRDPDLNIWADVSCIMCCNHFFFFRLFFSFATI